VSANWHRARVVAEVLFERSLLSGWFMTRHLAIGDIHGCFQALRTLADFIGIRAEDVLITLGDYVLCDLSGSVSS
jgi:hypothetical protein